MIKEKFKESPLMYYGLSIAASWAGVGSLLNCQTMNEDYGILPALVWTAANILACILFGYVVHKLPELREVVKTKAARYSLSVIAVFNIWLNMTGIQKVFADTTLGAETGTIIAYAVAVAFVIMLLWRGMVRNILTDGASWSAVYALVIGVTIAAYYNSGGEIKPMDLGLNADAMQVGFHKAALLLSGPFIYVYYYSLIDYNEANEARRVDMQKAFTIGGLMFGAYMVFAFALAFVNFPPTLAFLKAVLISLIAISTLSTFIYSIYLVFGRKIGLIIDSAAIASWSLVSEWGVMGIWTVGATVRSYLAVAFILVAIGMVKGNVRTQAGNED